MPSIGAVLRQEISRLSRREVRNQIEATKRASAQYRRHIAALKRQLTDLQRQVRLLGKRVPESPGVANVDGLKKSTRFFPAGLRSQRARLGLSQTDYGKLAGVSAQSIYNWERGSAMPRAKQMTVLAGLRKMGKKEALIRLKQLATGASKTRRKA